MVEKEIWYINLHFPFTYMSNVLSISMQSIDSVRNMPMIKLLHVRIYLMLDFFFFLQNQDNFLLDVGMNPVLESLSCLTGSQLMYHGSLKSKSTALLSIDIDELMNKRIKPTLQIIPKSIV